MLNNPNLDNIEEQNVSSFSEIDDPDLISFSNEYSNSSDIKKVSLVIENLKNDNVEIRRFCSQKLYELGNILGIERIQDELIPFITDLILNFEENGEILYEFSNQILALLLLLNDNKKYCIIGLRSLEILCSNDDESVRLVSVKNLTKFINALDDSHITADIFELLKRLMDNDSKSKMSTCYLLPVIYKRLKEANYKDEIFSVYISMGQEESPSVRLAAIENIQNFCVPEIINNDPKIFPALCNLYQRALEDKADIVKSHIVEDIPILYSFAKTDEEKRLIMNSFINAMKVEKSWRVKYSGSELICKICSNFEKEYNETTFVPIMEQFLNDKEPEVRCSVLTNFDKFLDCISMEKFNEKFLPAFKKLESDTNIHVRQVYASCLLKCIKFIKNDQTLLVNSILPSLSKLLKDDIYEVQYSAIGDINELIMIASDNDKLMSDCIIPIIEEGMNNPKWRFRLFIAENFLKVCPEIKKETIKKYFKKVISKLFTDNASEIREVSWKIIEEIVKKVDNTFLIDEMWEIIKEKLKSKNYILRIASMNSIDYLKKYFDASFLCNTVVDEIINIGKNDKVPNVKFSSFKVLKNLAIYLNKKDIKSKVKEYVQSFINDKDIDVVFFCKEALNSL